MPARVGISRRDELMKNIHYDGPTGLLKLAYTSAFWSAERLILLVLSLVHPTR